MATKNIEIQRYNGSSYDVLYPKTSNFIFSSFEYIGTGTSSTKINLSFIPVIFGITNSGGKVFVSANLVVSTGGSLFDNWVKSNYYVGDYFYEQWISLYRNDLIITIDNMRCIKYTLNKSSNIFTTSVETGINAFNENGVIYYGFYF